jgi:mono/diheme cytochrome c family protein
MMDRVSPSTHFVTDGIAILLVCLAGGCTSSTPEFEPNRLAMAEVELAPAHAEQIEQVLAELFGTPDEPRVPPGTKLDLAKLQMAAGQAGYVKDDQRHEYQQRGLYRQHCASCHGTTGDGLGTAAAVMEPYPRNYRPGTFKWKSTYHSAKPTDEDLRRVIEKGVPGTAMPSFALLDDEQTDSLVEYVKYLAMRGEVERELVEVVADEFDYDPRTGEVVDALDPAKNEEDQELVDEIVAGVMESWQQAGEQVVEPSPEFVPSENRTPEEIAASAKAGEALFLSQRAKCTECHGQPATGVVIKELDDWNRAVYDFDKSTATLAAQVDRRTAEIAKLGESQRTRADERLALDREQLSEREQVAATLLPPQLVRPRDFEEGVFRGGSDPEDLFRRIHQGIAGTPMPAAGSPRPGVAGALSEEEIWQLVDYVRTRAGYNN